MSPKIFLQLHHPFLNPSSISHAAFLSFLLCSISSPFHLVHLFHPSCTSLSPLAYTPPPPQTPNSFPSFLFCFTQPLLPFLPSFHCVPHFRCTIIVSHTTPTSSAPSDLPLFSPSKSFQLLSLLFSYLFSLSLSFLPLHPSFPSLRCACRELCCLQFSP